MTFGATIALLCLTYGTMMNREGVATISDHKIGQVDKSRSQRSAVRACPAPFFWRTENA